MDKNSLERYCLVTVGATVGFRELTQAVLEPSFWQFLSENGFTTLHIQCGPDIEWAGPKFASLKSEQPSELTIEIFKSRKNLLKEEMMLCKAIEGQRERGIVISHAGTGTILDAWKLGLQIIVVPNTQLLDDHQTELARHLAHEGYATMSTADSEDLQGAISKAELLWEENKTRWPPHEITPVKKAKLRLWEVSSNDVSREEDMQMAQD